jgi:uncharacterized membrane protein
MQSTIEQSIELRVPAAVAYKQWTLFEEFPQFMTGITEVKQLDDSHLHWHAQIGGKDEEWDAEITEQIPGKRIAWRNVSGATNAGVVTFHRLTDDTSRLMLQMSYTPDGVTETVGDALGVLRRRVARDLEQFKDFIEQRKASPAGWRGRIPSKDELVGQ